MAKTYSVLSHAQRMQDSAINHGSVSFPYDPTYKMYRVTDVVENGVVVKKSEVVTVDMSEEMSKYKVSDFKLENIIAAGAYDMLTPRNIMPDKLSDADHMNDVMDNIDAYMQNAAIVSENENND